MRAYSCRHHIASQGLITAAAIASTCSSAFANEAPNPSGRVLEEIIVSAQRREEKLQDVPISISVLSGRELDGDTSQGMRDVLMRVPGVAVSENLVGSNVQFSIRGVSTASALRTTSSTTAYYLDAAPFGFIRQSIGPDPNAYDLQRLEVLRGSQGTLYGASALNGVIRVLTNDADSSKLEFKARGLTSSTQDGGWNYRGDAAVNLPIVDDKLAVRAVVGYEDFSGWIDRPNHRDANESQQKNYRLKINATPTEALSVGLSAWSSRGDSTAPSVGREGLTHRSLVDEPNSSDYDVYSLKLEYAFPKVSVTSMTSYLDYSSETYLDLLVLGLPGRHFDYDLNAKSFSQEILLKSSGDGPWRWSIGGIYRDLDDSDWQFGQGVYLAPNHLVSTSKSYATFGELTRAFLDGRFELTAGLRYFEDDSTLDEQSRLTAVPADQLVHTEDTFEATTPRLVMTWKPNSQLNVYASYGEGFRSGIFQVPAVLAVAPLAPAKPDKLKNYEVGAKGSALSGRVAFDASLYYLDWQDPQQLLTVRVPVPTAPGFRDLAAIVNGESASGLGADLGLTLKLTNALAFGLAVSWNDLTSDRDIVSGALTLYEEGDRLANSVEYTVGSSLDYVFALAGGKWEGRFSLAGNYTSAQATRGVANGSVYVLQGDSLLIGRTSFSVTADTGWTASLFVDNLSNENGIPTPFLGVTDLDMRIRPRTVGLQLEYRY